MKKKWIALKRRWRKLHRMDRRAFRLFGTFTLLHLLLLLYSPVFIINFLPSVSLVILHFFHVCIRRNGQYAYWLKGCLHQFSADRINHRRVMYENAELKFKYDRLNAGYKKLESDYNKLKTKENKWEQASNKK